MAQLGDGLAASAWPGAIDTRQTYVNQSPEAPDGNTRLDAELVNDALQAILALQTGLGADPGGAFASVQARLDQYLPTTGVLTAGSIFFGGTGGILAESNADLFWDNTGKNLGIGTTSAFGSGAGVIGIDNAATVPTTNPATGGVLYAEGGALKWRSAGGLVTTIANNT